MAKGIEQGIINLQKKCEKYVVLKEAKTVRNLLDRNLFKFNLNDKEEVNSAYYLKPLNKNLDDYDDKQVYELAGLCLDPNNLSSIKSMLNLVDQFVETNSFLFAYSENPVIVKRFLENDFKQYTFREVERLYPKKFQMFKEGYNWEEVPEKYYNDSNKKLMMKEAV